MIDFIAFWFITKHRKHLEKFCIRKQEYDGGAKIALVTSNNEDSNPLFPMRVKLLESDKVLVSGSIHKFWNKDDHCNDTDFSIESALRAIFKILHILKIDVEKDKSPKITKIEFGVNIEVPHSIDQILKSVSKYKCYNFTYSRPKKGSKKKWGKEVLNIDYDIKLYNKSYLTNKELGYEKYSVENLLRLEIVYNNHLKRSISLNNVVELIGNMSIIEDLLLKLIDNIHFKPNLDYDVIPLHDLYVIEAINNPEFYEDTKSLGKVKKAKIKRHYNTILKKYPCEDYSKVVYLKLSEKIKALATVETFPDA